jgi:hypothetical protein
MMESYHGASSPPQWPLRPGHQLPPLPLAMRPATAAKAIGISERTLWTMTKRGDIPHARLGNAVIYPTSPLIRWLEEQTVHPLVKRPEQAAGGDA